MLTTIRLLRLAALAVTAASPVAAADDAPPASASEPPSAALQPAGADSRWPMFLGAQYTFIDQSQTSLYSPYQGKLSLNPAGDRQATHTFGIYTGWAPWSWGPTH